MKIYVAAFNHTTFSIIAANLSDAIQCAKELAGPGAIFLSCIQREEW